VRVLRREPLVAVLPAIHALAGYTTVPLADFGTNRSTTDGRARRGSARRWVARGRVTRLGVP
jgi:hypothetical protein